MAVKTPTFLYRVFDANGELLYIGITYYLHDRLVRHRKRQPWAESMARVESLLYPCRLDAELAEAAAIRDELPLHNRLKNTASLSRWGL